jgi:cytidylate kinase
MPVITISRQYGSGAKEIAMRVCEILGYSYFDKNLMARVASEVGLAEHDIVDFSEDTYKMRSLFERLFGRRRQRSDAWGPETSAATKLQVELLDEAMSVNLVKDTVIAAHKHDNIVIVGRGGQAILQHEPAVLHVRITAPLGARTMRIKEREYMNLDDATNLVKSKDQNAAAYLQRFFDIDWDNPLLYHLCINTGKWELDDATDIIINALSRLKTGHTAG